MLGTGVGNSYGGIGLRAQGRFGGKTGFGIHGGVGYRPDAGQIFASAGIKFFPYKGFYINTQFGYTGYESYHELYSGSYIAFNRTLYGPSFLIGIDQVWGGRVGLGFNAGLGVSYNINTYTDYNNSYTSSTFALALDLGFIVRF